MRSGGAPLSRRSPRVKRRTLSPSAASPERCGGATVTAELIGLALLPESRRPPRWPLPGTAVLHRIVPRSMAGTTRQKRQEMTLLATRSVPAVAVLDASLFARALHGESVDAESRVATIDG